MCNISATAVTPNNVDGGVYRPFSAIHNAGAPIGNVLAGLCYALPHTSYSQSNTVQLRHAPIGSIGADADAAGDHNDNVITRINGRHWHVMIAYPYQSAGSGGCPPVPRPTTYPSSTCAFSSFWIV